MTEVDEPDWLRGFEAKPAPDKWIKGMPSPNKSGRPRGIVDKRMKVSQALLGDAPAVARVVVDAALSGDLQACSIVLARCSPAIKARAERVEFELCPDRTLADQAQQILQAVADGHVDPDTGKMLIGCIESVSSIKAVQDLEARLSALEEGRKS
jgi:hypothetical protein